MALRGLLFIFGLHGAAGLDNGWALTPPMGWRSWNSLGADVTQERMLDMAQAMASRNRTVNGKPASLIDIGYKDIGLDDGWQNMSRCGAKRGWNGGTFHDDMGRPMVNTTRFPDMRSMTDAAHKLGLYIGFYLNNCICQDQRWSDRFSAEPSWFESVYEQSAKATVEWGYDSVKLDGCGEYLDMHKWVASFEAAGKKIMVENCHWGCTTPNYPTVKPIVTANNVECAANNIRPPWPIAPLYPTQTDGSCNGTEDVSNCPYNMYRTSFDISANWQSMFQNLQSVVPFLGEPPLSRPGAWAYPDMLEVGRLSGFHEDRTHFGAWCIVSSPLVLGLDLTDKGRMDAVWEIITNTEAIAVNQAWAGHPGRRVKNEANLQIWSKPLSEGRQAVFLINLDDDHQNVTVQLSDLGFQEAVSVRDVWEHKDLGMSANDSFITDSFGHHDSRFYIFSPAADGVSYTSSPVADGVSIVV